MSKICKICNRKYKEGKGLDGWCIDCMEKHVFSNKYSMSFSTCFCGERFPYSGVEICCPRCLKRLMNSLKK